jgi:hypothetical protein
MFSGRVEFLRARPIQCTFPVRKEPPVKRWMSLLAVLAVFPSNGCCCFRKTPPPVAAAPVCAPMSPCSPCGQQAVTYGMPATGYGMPTTSYMMPVQ